MSESAREGYYSGEVADLREVSIVSDYLANTYRIRGMVLTAIDYQCLYGKMARDFSGTQFVALELSH